MLYIIDNLLQRGKRPAVESDAPSKRKQLKLEVIGEEEEEVRYSINILNQ